MQMQSVQQIQYEEMEAAISVAGLELNAAEVHGIICGAICNQMKTGTAPDMNQLITAGADVQSGSLEQLQSNLELLLRGAVEELHRDDGDFRMLLPDDEVGLTRRLQSLADWCRGFLLGLLDGERVAVDEFSADAAEVARDMIAVSELEADGDGEDSEWDLAQVEEYVRVGVQLIFAELHADLHGDVESEELH